MASILPTVSDCCDSCGSCDTTVTVSTGGTSGLFVRNTLDDIRAISVSDIVVVTSGDIFAVALGGAAAYDGGGGNYGWNSTSTDADDGINILEPDDSTGAGRWQKIL